MLGYEHKNYNITINAKEKFFNSFKMQNTPYGIRHINYLEVF